MNISQAVQPALDALQHGDFGGAEACLLDILRDCDEAASQFAQAMPNLVRSGHIRDLKIRIQTLQAQAPGNVVVKLLELYLSTVEAKFLRLDCLDEADIARRVPLFTDKSSKFLSVNLNIPITTCNYRCEYCFLQHQIKPDLDKLAKMDAIIDRLASIPRPLGITVGPSGEVMAVPKTWPLLGRAARLSNTVWVETWSNLSRDPELLFDHIDPKKLCLIATYHPTEFRDFARENTAFFERLARAKGLVRDISVNFVIYEKNMPFVAELRDRLDRLGIYLTVNPQINTHNGYGAPIQPVTGAEFEFAKSMIDNKYIDYYFLQNRKADVRCTAGRDMIDIDWNGDVTRCEHLRSHPGAAESLGNIFDDNGPLIDTANRFCAKGGCACKSTIGYIEPFVADYKRIGTQHKFHRRPTGEVGTHSYDPVDLSLACAPIGADSVVL